METKVVKLEIGKVLAIVIAIVVVASVAGVLLQSNYFQGNIGEVSDTNPLPAKEGDYFTRIEQFKTNIEKGLDFESELGMLKKDLDSLVMEKVLDSDVAGKTIEAFSSMKGLDKELIIKTIDAFVPAYQKTSDVSGFAGVMLKEGKELVSRDRIITVVDTLKVASDTNLAVAVTDFKDDLVEAGVGKIETVKLDEALLKTVSTFRDSDLDAAFQVFQKDIYSDIEFNVAFDKFESNLDGLKREVAIEVTRDLPGRLAKLEKGSDTDFGHWVGTVDALTVKGFQLNKDVFGKYFESGKRIEILAKSLDAFSANIEKGLDVDAAFAMFMKEANSSMPGLIVEIPQF